MTIDITIAENREFVVGADPHAGSSHYAQRPCPCPRDGNGEARANCPECCGAGVIQEATLPWVLNLANANFTRLWSALGFYPAAFGSIDGRALWAALEVLAAQYLTRAEFVTCFGHMPTRSRPRRCGIESTQATRYVFELAAIAAEAERREQPVVWG